MALEMIFFRSLGLLARMLSLLLVLLLSACITTESGSVIQKPDEAKALEYSVQLARNYIRKGNWDAAKRHLKNALAMGGNKAEVHEAMALVLQNTGEIERAEEHYRKAIELDRKLSRARNNYAAFLYQQQRYQQAAEQLEEVAADVLYERRAAAYMNLGRCYFRLKKFVEAEAALKRAFLMESRNVAIMLELAEVYFQLENYPEAQRFYDGFRKQTRQQPAGALWLGIRLADRFDDQNALSSYALALKNLYPRSKEYLQYKRAYSHDG